MLSKTIKGLVILIFLLSSIIHSHLLDTFGIKEIWKFFHINGNYEFFKVSFINIFTSLSIFLFLVEGILKKRKYHIPKLIYVFIFILFLSSLFSISPLISILWNNEKWHWVLFFINLLWLFIILINTKLKTILLKVSILSWVLISIISIKEFLLPSFDYWDLSNRAIWSFGHPNYLAMYLLMIIVIISKLLNDIKQKNKKYILISSFLLVCVTIILTKSIWAIFLFSSYFIYLNYSKLKKLIWKRLFNKILVFLFVLFLVWILKYYPEKLSSFISRFYIWETTFSIVLSDLKIFTLWNWLWNLNMVFETFKVKELYIFENYWFVADRPHNIFLYVFYSFGLVWLSFFIYLIICFYKNIFKILGSLKKMDKNYITMSLEIFSIFLLFNIFNFSSSASYLVVILSLSIIYTSNKELIKWNNYLISGFFILVSIFWIYFYWNYFLEERKYYNNSLYKTDNHLLEKMEFEDREKTIFKEYKKDPKRLCENLIKYGESAENYIYCWNLLYFIKRDLSLNYYKLWLEKLPNLWDDNSKYYQSIFVNKKNLKHRFFSEKYSNTKEVLERVEMDLEDK